MNRYAVTNTVEGLCGGRVTMRRQWSVLLTLILPLVLASISHAQQPTVTYAAFTPMVVDATQPVNVVLEAKVTGSPTSVRLLLNSTGKEVILSDDGTAPDKVAGDGIYTIQLSPAEVLSNLRE